MEWRARQELGGILPNAAVQKKVENIRAGRAARSRSPPAKDEDGLPSIRLSFEEKAAASLRKLFLELQTGGAWRASIATPHDSAFIKERYLQSCYTWNVKPNSQALLRIVQ